jgi:CHAT domain
MSFHQEIETFLQGKSALALIQCFDAEFDIPFTHSQCTGLLEMLGAYEPTDLEDDRRLAERVGAWWCRIIHADVSYNILDGLESIRASEFDAGRLRQRVIDRRFDSESPNEQMQKIAYIAARWHDGAAKIHYRCNDHTEARLLFHKARELVERANLWYCLPDIQSNCLRVDYEENRAVGRQIDLKTQYQELRDQTIQIAEQNHIPIPSLSEANCSLKYSIQDKEFLRGLASIFHNLSLELSKTDIESSHKTSQCSEAICRVLGDGYRLAQALNHQGLLALKRNNLQSARQCFQEVTDLPWQRGKLIAEQNLAKIDAQENLYDIAFQQITHLLDQVQKNNQRRGGDLGFDSDFHYFTVQAFKSILERAIETQQINQENTQHYRKELSKEQLQMVRSIRKVVKITTYKTAFSQRVYPIYLQLIGDRIPQLLDQSSNLSVDQDSRSQEVTFTLIEEASSRELLDLLKVSTLPSNTKLMLDLNPIHLGPVGTEAGAEPHQSRRGGLRLFGSQANDLEVLSLLDQRRLRYEESSLTQPIATSEPNPDIAYEIRMFTANHPGLVIVRYFFYSTAQQRELAAYIFRDGDLYLQRLDWQRIQQELISHWEDTWGSGSGRIGGDGRRLSRLLIEPLWSSVTAKGDLNEHCHLVLIPSEELFKLPLHVAFVPGETIPLAAYVPLSFSVSATAYVTRGRHLMRRQRVENDDDLCALVKRDDQVSGREITGLSWPAASFHIAGQPPEGVSSHQYHGQADRQGLAALLHQKPEFFTYAGHGLYTKALESVGPALELEGDCLTQFDIAMGLRLPRNKLTLLGACVSGQGANLGGGEVSGFIRAFIAAGCGALGITLWPVLDDNIANTIRHLLNQAQSAARNHQTFDVVQELYEYYRVTCRELDNPSDRIEACPLALYL